MPLKCSCGAEITSYRTVGVFLAFDDLDKKEYFDRGLDVFYFRVDSGCKALKMTQCPECGKVEFYGYNARALNGLAETPNSPDMERLTNA